METLTQLIHQAHGSGGHESQLLGEEPYSLGQKDEELSKTFALSHGLALNLFELNLEHFFVFFDVLLVQNVIGGHLDCDFLEFLKQGVVDCLLVLLLHWKVEIYYYKLL